MAEVKQHIPDTRIIKTYAKNNMNGLRTALELGISECTVRARFIKIHAKTGVDPCSFYGLCKLLTEIKKKAEECKDD